MKIATYHRCSTLDQDPTLAREELAAAGRRMGDLVLAIEERGSGARNDRPGLQRLMRAARAGQIDAVMVWKLDRFGRSSLDVLSNIEALTAAGVRFVATSQQIDVRPAGDAMSRLQVTILSAVAEFERDLIRDRTLLGLRKARAAGKHLGRPPVLSSAEAEEARRQRTKGRSWSQIAADLQRSMSSVRRAVVRRGIA